MAHEGFQNMCAVQCMANQPVMQVIFMENGSNPLRTESVAVLNLQHCRRKKPNVFSILVGSTNNNSEWYKFRVELTSRISLNSLCFQFLSRKKNRFILVKVQNAPHFMTMYVHSVLLFFNLKKYSGLPKINIFPAS